MDRIRIFCPGCKRQLLAPLLAAGKHAKCSRCGLRLQIPLVDLPMVSAGVPDDGSPHAVECGECGQTTAAIPAEPLHNVESGSLARPPDLPVIVQEARQAAYPRSKSAVVLSRRALFSICGLVAALCAISCLILLKASTTSSRRSATGWPSSIAMPHGYLLAAYNLTDETEHWRLQGANRDGISDAVVIVRKISDPGLKLDQAFATAQVATEFAVHGTVEFSGITNAVGSFEPEGVAASFEGNASHRESSTNKGSLGRIKAMAILANSEGPCRICAAGAGRAEEFGDLDKLIRYLALHASEFE